MAQSLSFLFLLHFLNDGMRTGMVSLLPFVARDFHLSYTLVGLLGSSQGVLAAILSIPAIFLAYKRNYHIHFRPFYGIHAVFYISALLALTATIPLLFYKKTTHRLLFTE